MPAESTSSLPSIDTPIVQNPDNVRPVYANTLGISATLTDVQLIFTQVYQGSGNDGGAVEPKNSVVAMVTIPLAVVAQLSDGLKTTLENHKAVVNAHMSSKS